MIFIVFAALRSEDHQRIVSYLTPLRRQEVIRLGEKLGLSHRRLDDENSNLPDDMVNSWLKKDDGVLKTGSPTWENLCKALEECGHNGIAFDIRKKGIAIVV